MSRIKRKIFFNENTEITLREAYEKFIQQKKVLNVSPDTIDYYNDCWRYFTDFIDQDTLCNQIDEDSIMDYLVHLRETKPNISDITVNTYLRAIRAIFYNFMKKGFVEEFKIQMIRAEKKIKETYTDEELVRLLEKPDIKKVGFAEYRNWVIITYLLGTGNRSRTMCNVKIGDIDFVNHEIKLKTTKNNKQYIIPLATSLEKILLEYLQYRNGSDDDYLFCNQYGERMSRDTHYNFNAKLKKL